MPAPIVHQGANVICMHSGQAQPTAPFPRVTVSQQPIAIQSTLYVIAGCALSGTSTPPCVTAQWTAAATRVFAGGLPVVTQVSQSVCTPTGQPLLVLTTQTRVFAT